MGIALPPNYANLFMDRFEPNALKLGQTTSHMVKIYNDILMIWNHCEEELTKFLNYLHNIHDKTKFTHEFSKEAINFLDTTVKIDSTRELYTTLYEKTYRHSSALTLHICTP